jgi:hypothetical protein
VTSLKQHEYEENSDWVKDLEDTVVRAENEGWPDRENQGYVGFSVSVEWKPLRREPGMLRVLVTVCVNEGQQKRLKAIEFRYVGGSLGRPVFHSDDRVQDCGDFQLPRIASGERFLIGDQSVPDKRS